MKAAFLAYIRLLEVDKAAFVSLADVIGKNRWGKIFFSEISFIYKAAFPSPVDVFGKNRSAKFFFSEIILINIHRASRS